MVTIKNNKVADSLGIVILILMAIGTVFVFSAGANLSQQFSLQRFYEFTGLRQILFFPLACIIMYSVSLIDYHAFGLNNGWKKSVTTYMLIVSIILLIIVLMPRFGTSINQARRWLRIPLGFVTISFQPSELAKWAVIFFLAGFCDKYHITLKLYWKRFIPVCCVVGLIVGLILIEDFGTAAFISLLTFLILIIGGVRWWHILTPLPFAAIGFFIAVINSPSRVKRIAAFLHPEKWTDTAYQANQSLIALGSGGILGKGLGRGISKYGHLPEDTTDFIFAIIGEELGFVGTTTVIGLFIVFVWLGILVIARSSDRFGQMLAGGIVLTIAAQAAINIGVVTVVLPTKGIPLPFVSAGGTSMLLSSVAVGVLLNIARQTSKEEIGEISNES